MIEDFDQHVSRLGFGRSKPRVWTWKMQQVKKETYKQIQARFGDAHPKKLKTYVYYIYTPEV